MYFCLNIVTFEYFDPIFCEFELEYPSFRGRPDTSILWAEMPNGRMAEGPGEAQPHITIKITMSETLLWEHLLQWGLWLG